MKRHSFGSDSACHVLGLASVMGFVALALCSGAKLLTKFHIRGLSGSWNASSESLVLQAVPGKIVFRFHSRDLHLMQALAKDAKPVRFVVRLDGAAPGDNCVVDTTQDGSGEIRESRLYQLIRQKGPIVDRTFEIEFLDPGIQALDFTFG